MSATNHYVHCWHTSNVQHAAMNHRCETCCHCGAGRCITTTPPTPPAGHGPFYPAAVTSVWATGDLTITGNDG